MTGTRTRWAVLAVALATFMTYLDNNIVNVAIPAIQRDLGLSTAGLEWVVSGYILTFAALLLAGGRLADVYGRRRLFLTGLAVFTVASLTAGLAGSVAELVASRAVQGAGAALVTPTTLAIITAAYPDVRRRAAAIGVWSAVGALALAVGPLLGGLLSQHVSWEWIFFINVPLGIGTFALGAWAIEESRGPARRFDVPGVAVSALALGALTFALIEGHSYGWTSPSILALFALAVASGLAFVRIEAGRRDDAMVPLAVFRHGAFSGGLVALMMWGFGLFGIYFFTSIYLQVVLGFSATVAGAAFVPMALLMAFGAAVSDRVGARLGAHRSVGLAMALMALGIGATALLGRHAGFLDLMPPFVVIGIGGGLSIPLTSTVVGVLPADQAGIASGIFNAARETAGLLGITVIGAVLTARQDAVVRAGHDALTGFLSGYRLGLVVAAALVALGGAVAWRALRPADVTAPARDLEPV